MRLKVREPAPVGTRFAPGAFDKTIGDRVVLVGVVDAAGTLIAAEVEPDGSAAVLTLDFPELEGLPE